MISPWTRAASGFLLLVLQGPDRERPSLVPGDEAASRMIEFAVESAVHKKVILLAAKNPAKRESLFFAFPRRGQNRIPHQAHRATALLRGQGQLGQVEVLPVFPAQHDDFAVIVEEGSMAASNFFIGFVVVIDFDDFEGLPNQEIIGNVSGQR